MTEPSFLLPPEDAPRIQPSMQSTLGIDQSTCILTWLYTNINFPIVDAPHSSIWISILRHYPAFEKEGNSRKQLPLSAPNFTFVITTMKLEIRLCKNFTHKPYGVQFLHSQQEGGKKQLVLEHVTIAAPPYFLCGQFLQNFR